jgi:hypothetical protein
MYKEQILQHTLATLKKQPPEIRQRFAPDKKRPVAKKLKTVDLKTL